MAKKLPKVDLAKLTAADIDKMSHAALRDAVRSVLRDPNVAATHKDHRSHSSTDTRVLSDRVLQPDISGTKAGGGGR